MKDETLSRGMLQKSEVPMNYAIPNESTHQSPSSNSSSSSPSSSASVTIKGNKPALASKTSNTGSQMRYPNDESNKSITASGSSDTHNSSATSCSSSTSSQSASAKSQSIGDKCSKNDASYQQHCNVDLYNDMKKVNLKDADNITVEKGANPEKSVDLKQIRTPTPPMPSSQPNTGRKLTYCEVARLSSK